MPVSIEPGVKLNTREFTAWATCRLAQPADDEVHVWYAICGSLTPDPARLDHFLSEDENTRAACFRFEEHRRHFVRSHAMVRLLIASYYDASPKEICFSVGSHGKPSIDASQASGLTFNLSHADGIILCAFANRRQIGVDVEQVRVNFNLEEVGERFFSAAERHVLRRVPANEKHSVFFRFWTRKEAYIKARGEGLSHPLHQFDVSLANAGNVLASTRPDAEEANRWVVWNVGVPRGYVAAVAFEATAPEQRRIPE